MPQVFMLTEIFLLLSSFVMLSNKIGPRFLLLLNLRSIYVSSKTVRCVWFVFGAILTLLNLFFPVDPGPVILGDIMPAMTILIVLLRLVMVKEREENDGSVIELHDNTFDWCILGVAVLHFLFPGIVII